MTLEGSCFGADLQYRSMMRAGMQVAAIFQEHDSVIGLAKLASTFDDGFENRSDIGWR
jgi:hypothetical protein